MSENVLFSDMTMSSNEHPTFDLTAVSSHPSSALHPLHPLLQEAQAYARASQSSSTRRAYRTSWGQFASWCDGHQLASLPASPETVVLYLTHLIQSGRSVSTLERTLAALAAAHRAAGFSWPKGHPALAMVVTGIRRTHGKAPKKKTPLEDKALRSLVQLFDDSLRGLRDRALLLVGWFGAFRRSELVALSVGDARFEDEGLRLLVRRSKTDQESKGLEKGLPYTGDPRLCPVRALRRWLEAAKITEGPIFRAISKTGKLSLRALSDRSVARLLQAAAEAAGLDAREFGGHSLRSGFVTTAARRGKSLDAIMRQTGHRSERIARSYIRHATLFVDNAAAGIF